MGFGNHLKMKKETTKISSRIFFPTKSEQGFSGTPSELSIFHTSVSVVRSFKCDEIPLNNNWCLYELWTYYLQGFLFQGLGVYCTKFRTYFLFFSHYSHLFWAQGDPPNGTSRLLVEKYSLAGSQFAHRVLKTQRLPCKLICISLGKFKCSMKMYFGFVEVPYLEIRISYLN